MAVYTHLDDSDFHYLVGEFGLGELTLYKGIAEGVSNSNFIVETALPDGKATRHIVTIYEERTDVADLPFFLGLLDHLAAKGCPVPATIHDKAGNAFRLHHGKALAFIEFLPGFTLSHPTPAQGRAVGAALAQVHLAAGDFAAKRENGMGPAEWQRLLGACGQDGLATIDPQLAALVGRELPALVAAWPDGLPRGVIHADLFPDNVLMLGNEVTGLIDFYFACTDMLAYDVAVTHAAWCFDSAGREFLPDLSQALIAGYESVRPLSGEECSALPLLARGAAMRFLATRAYDWLNTPADALVTRKDPMAFARRLEFYADPANAGIFA
ncbi:homoserine kinase [Novosphingobium sp. TH158]|uniref:homoserine kinase n=1 Tax=Novosphingobium sp. TH158 TaxID=2067455 RepID=UPI000C7D130E|nr:homoserine kinase [Novosphingobium sp. TH158]PLK25492.1 homoserine kinase [Novosphingobium sp. TH158]